MSGRGGIVARGRARVSRHSAEMQADAFTQAKLERYYYNTYRLLYVARRWLGVLCDILVWNKPVASGLLYLAVHWLFVLASTSSVPLLGHAGNLVLMGVILDVLYRAATNKFESSHAEEDSLFSLRSVGQKKKKKEKMERPMSFENTFILSTTPLKSQELPCYDLVCLWLATAAMWLDNLYVALRHWSIQEPLLFFMCLLVPGVLLSLLGKYVPTIVVVYVLVMALLVWPYVEYHDLRVRAGLFLQTNYPLFVKRMENYWQAVKVFVAKDRTDFFEVALGKGGEDDQSTAQALGEAFVEATHLKDERRIEGGAEPVISGQNNAEERRNQYGRLHKRNVDPGMSVLQDSVLGMQANAFQGMEDSLGSLALPPGGLDPVDQSIGLPRFPEVRTSDRVHVPRAAGLAVVSEDDFTLPSATNSHDLDPFADSVEMGPDWPDGNGRRGYRAQRPANTTSTPSMLDILEEPHDNSTAFATTGYQPPPSYQAAAGGYDGAVASEFPSSSREEHQRDPSDAMEATVKGGYMLRHRQ